MQIGFPTHPRKDVIDEIRWIGENGFAFAELFFEPDKNVPENLDVKKIKEALEFYNLASMGHTAWNLPIGSEHKELRKTAVRIIESYLDVFAALNTPKVTVHANWPAGLFSEAEGIKFQIESLAEIIEYADKLGIMIIYESLDTRRCNKENIQKILSSHDKLGFHADIGHINIWGRKPIDYMEYFKNRLEHIHMHDNDGQRDLHLPLGAGIINWHRLISRLKKIYNGTITLEIFSQDKDYVLYSKRTLESIWNNV